MANTDDPGAPKALRCESCAAPLEPGHITCPGCGRARFLGGTGGGLVPPPPSDPAPGQGGPGPVDAEGTDAEDGPFDLGDPFRDPVRRRPRGPAQRSRTTLLLGGIVGLVLVALVAAAALWALRQNGGVADF